MRGQFRQISDELTGLIGQWEPRLMHLPQAAVSGIRNKQNRSVREILGHMIDSASNNTHRIVHLQYRESPVAFPDYANHGNNDRWIDIQKYQDEEYELLVTLWAASNRHLAHIITRANQEKLQQVWISALEEEITLEAMILDYPKHFRLHLGEIESLIQTT